MKMKLKIKKLVCGLMALVMTATVLTGCGGNTDSSAKKKIGKETVSVVLWGTQLLENYTQYLCDTFPEVEFEFSLATNSTDYASFTAACEAFEELGIQGFCSDFGSDYTCMEVL